MKASEIYKNYLVEQLSKDRFFHLGTFAILNDVGIISDIMVRDIAIHFRIKELKNSGKTVAEAGRIIEKEWEINAGTINMVYYTKKFDNLKSYLK